MSKKFWESKTVWFNLATTLAAVLALSEVTTIIPMEALPYLLAFNGVVNVILRVWFTDKPVE